MERKNLIYVVLGLVFVGLVINAGIPRTTISEASWAHYYNSIDDLYKAADLVVLCEVTSTVSYKEMEFMIGSGHLISTNYTLTIIDTYKGEAEGNEIIVHQTGGILGKQKQLIEDDPLLEKDVRMILFLRRFHSSNYAILGGPQGRFIVQEGKVYSIGEVDSNAYTTTKHLATKGSSVESFLNKVK